MGEPVSDDCFIHFSIDSNWCAKSKRDQVVKPDPFCLWIAGAGFEPATFGLCLPLQLSLPERSVCGLDFPFTLSRTVRVPPIKSLHLLAIKLRAWLGITIASGFPEFER